MYTIIDKNGFVIETARTAEEAAEKQRKYAEERKD